MAITDAMDENEVISMLSLISLLSAIFEVNCSVEFQRLSTPVNSAFSLRNP